MVKVMAKKDSIQTEVKKLRAKVDDLKRKVGPKLEEGKEFLMHEEKEAEKYIKANPIKAVGVAFAVGFFLGRLSK